MAFDPRYEDYTRLKLRYAQSLDGHDDFNYVHELFNFEQSFAPLIDEQKLSEPDRAFHRAAQAALLIDYELPFAQEDAYETILKDADRLLAEALDIHPLCHDATRMQEIIQATDLEEYYRFLADMAKGVKVVCEYDQRQAEETFVRKSQRELAADLAMRPYIRWMATLAAKALICGHYKVSLNTATALLEFDKRDSADVRFTGLLAAAKLEDEEALLWFAEQTPAKALRTHPDAWQLITTLALAYKQGDSARAAEQIGQMLHYYPHAAIALVRQDEFPDGVFARHIVVPFSEDELLLAISEATPLFQEGRNEDTKGPLGAWVASQEQVLRAAAQDEGHSLVRSYELEEISSRGKSPLL